METRYKELMSKALARIDELQTQLGAAQRDAGEPIAIVGLGCRFPGGGNGPRAFWEALSGGVDAAGEIPPDRWDVEGFFDPASGARGKMYCRSGSFLKDVYGFDPRFFGISPREALMMDPQQRLLLEVAWETLENAGIPPERLRGSQTGVFVGSMSYDFLQLMTDPSAIDLHSGTGSALSVASGRLSYLLDFHGPTLTVDTACSSSLVAVHLACRSLRLRECDFALAGGVNVMISPLMGVAECAANMLAPDGRCKTFDASANGYGRGEGCGMVLLKRLSDAIADRDRIVAVIRGSAVNHGGQSSGLTVPNPLAQAAVMRAALANAGVEPEQVAYVEAHGTGTPLGDPIEIGGLQSVYCRNRSKDDALLVGSVKSNVGHLEGAAGIAALIKTALALEHGEIPPHQHFHEPNPHIDWNSLAIEIPVGRNVPWPGGRGSRIAGISSFGFSGTNVHLLLEEAPARQETTGAAPSHHLLTLSAKTAGALEQTVVRYIDFLERHPELAAADLCFSANTTRSHFERRFTATVSSRGEALEKLKAYAEKQAGVPGAFHGNSAGKRRGGVVFVFPGEGVVAGRELYETQPAFRRGFDLCAEIARPLLNRSLKEALDGLAAEEISGAFGMAARFAYQYALAELWKALGVMPSAVLGERAGEYAAACVAGVFGPEQALALIAGQAPGAASCREPEIPYGSAAAGGFAQEEVTQGRYWQNLLSSPARLPEALRAAVDAGEEIFLEMTLAPQPDAMGREVSSPSLYLPRPASTGGEIARLSAILGELYVHGLDPDWREWYRDAACRRVVLPGYPFQRKEYRLPLSVAHSGGGSGTRHPLLGGYVPPGEPSNAHVWRGIVAAEEIAWLRDHRIGEQSVFPAVAYVEMANAAFRFLNPGSTGKIAEIGFERPLLLDAESPCELETAFTEEPEGGYAFVISSRTGSRPWLRNAAGRIAKTLESRETVSVPCLLDGGEEETGGKDFYDAWKARGNDWGGWFRGIDRLWKKDGELVARIPITAEIGGSLEKYYAQPALLDACGHLLAAFAQDEGKSGRFMARKMSDVRLYAPLRGPVLWSHAVLREGGEGRTLSGSIEIMDEAGQVLAEVRDCRFEFIDMDMAGEEPVAAEKSLYAVEWREASPPENAEGGEKDWIVLSDRQGFGTQVAAALRERGASAALIPPGADFQYGGDSGRPLRIVDLRCLDVAEMNAAAVGEAGKVAAGIAQTLNALRAVRSLPQTRLWLVTRGAWSGAPQQAVFWGLGRTMALEHALLWGGLADLDPADDGASSARQLVALLDSGRNEDQVRFHDGKTLVARLAGIAPEQVLAEPPQLHKEGSYLITGGLGNIGLEIARTLAERGAGTLVLIGRSPLAPRAEWESADPAGRDGKRIAAIRHIESLGAAVVTVALDVADEAAFRAWHDAFQAAGHPPVRGVIHAAGHADRKLLADLDAEAVAAHLAPKMGGAIVLDKALEHAPLDFFIMLSSASALLSSPELGAYAAANAFLDALASERRARGKPGLSIAWGPWKDAGMAAEGFSDGFKAIRALPAGEALALMGRLWNAPAGYLAVLPLDWGVWARHYPSAAGVPLLSDLLAERGASVAAAQAKGAEEAGLLGLPLEERKERLLAWLGARIARIFGAAAGELSVDEPLSAQGMDSLMALEIRNAIETGLALPIPIVELMGGISLRELAALLANRAEGEAPAAISLAAGADEAEAVPLTNGQRALWLIHELAPESSAYHVAFALRFDSPLDLDAMRGNFRLLVERHAALRSVMAAAGEKVVQRVLAEPHFGFEVVDATGWDDQRLKEEVAAAYARPFELAAGPLFRVHFFSRGTDDHVMLLVAHHIVCDGWSLWILIEEFGILCEEDKNAVRLAPLPYRFADYARWQERLLDSAEGERLWAFWRERLAGDLPVLNLPTDRPRPMVQTYAGSTHRFLLPRELSASLSELGRRYGATDYMLLLAAYNVLLHRYSGQTELLVGCPTSGRSSGQLTGVVGHFINPVVLRSDLSGDPSFADFLLATRQVVLEALAHQEYPFSLIVEKIQPERDPGRSPIFQTDFTLQRPQQSKEIIDMMIPDGMDAPGLRWGSLEPVPYEIAQQEGQFDLSFEAVEGSGSYFCFLKYNTDLFDAATMERMGGHFRALLEGILEAPERKISTLPLLTAQERDMLLHRFNDTAADYPTDNTLSRAFEEQARKTPDKLAVVFNGARKTYGELNAQANRIAAALRRFGVKTGDFVGILDMRGDDFLAAMLGTLKAGGAYVPIDPDYPGERIRYMVEDSQVEVLVSRAAFAGEAFASPALRHVLLLEGDGEALAGAYPGVCFHAPAELAQESDANPPPQSGPRDRAYMIYTSGSTGAPKGAIVRHDGALNHIYAQFEALAFHGESVFLQSAPSSSDISVWQFLAPLLIGGRTVVADFATVCSAESLYRLIAEERVTLIELVPAVLEELIGHARALPGSRLDALEWAMVTGEAASVSLVNRWFGAYPGVPLVNAYGPTEAADDICQYVIREALPASTHNVPIGTPLGNLTLYILDEKLQLVPVGIPGEICVSGIGVGEGYWRKPEKTAESFVANPYAGEGKGAVLYRTGDQGRWLPDGNIECLGRNDDQVKIRGFRIELGEIEAVLMRHPDVRQALVVAWGDAAAKRLVAYVLPESGKAPSGAALRSFAGEALPVHMVPSSVVFLEHFPLLPNGKVNRKALPSPDFAEAPASLGEAPRNATESRIAAIWKALLQRETVGIHDNFFELGGHSLLMSRLHRRVEAEFGVQFPLVTMFQYPTVNSLAKYLRPGEQAETGRGAASLQLRNRREGSPDIAIVGMSCRFPGAENVGKYWRNLRDKVESVTFFSDEELLARGVEPGLIRTPGFVPACAPLEGLDLFDAPFFGFNAREAEIMDPQHRLFLECAWEALEHAGYAPDSAAGMLVGCFAGQGMTAYLSNNVQPNLDRLESAYLYQVEISNDKDYLATSAGYKLNLQGPCVTVQSACSTSLVAIHMACKSLLDGECDMALAGSVSANVLHQSGYLYQEGMILSPDGHCRPFDKDARGTIPGSGLAVVALKKLDRALADGDTIHAVIKGSALNNDGSLKAGYTAPSVEGQVGVVARAYAAAGVDPATVTYLAAHGTATPMGDPIEVAALSQVFKNREPGASRCALGSVKANIGHTDTAAGVASLIAAAMAMKHRQIPPQLHFHEANPAIDFSATPFYVNSEAVPWEPLGMPRRAGISSLGIGGTNVHLVLEEAPLQPLRDEAETRPVQLLLLSARTASALDRTGANLAAHLDDERKLSLADAAYTLAIGRKQFAQRRALLCRDRDEALAALTGSAPTRVFAGSCEAGERPVTFMFTGQGSQYAGMGRKLYRNEPEFRRVVDEALELFESHLGIGLRQILFPAEGEAAGKIGIDQTLAAQPLLFTLEYATAKLLESWGIRPASMIGHSIGEYAAACLAGVFSFEDAIFLVSQRARLMQGLPGGAMSAVQLPEQELQPYLGENLSLAAVNSSQLCVVSGDESAIDALEKRLQAEGKVFRRLHTSHAFHSAAMDPVEEAFTAQVRNIRLNPPAIPFLSNLTGTWITAEQATDPAYWFKHLRHTVKFATGLAELLKDGGRILLEVGPGNALCTFALQHAGKKREQLVLGCHPSAREKGSETEWLFKTLAKLWIAGVEIDWNGFYRERERRRIPLPTYPFERQRYWMAPRKEGRGPAREEQSPARRADVGEWFAVPSWQRSRAEGPAVPPDFGPWLVFADDPGFGERMAEALRGKGCAVTMVLRGAAFGGSREHGYTLDPRRKEEYRMLFDALSQDGNVPKGVLHLWGYAGENREWAQNIDAGLDLGFSSLFHIGKELGRHYNGEKTYLKAVLSDTQDVSGAEFLDPLKGSVAGLMKVVGQEYPGILCQSIDFSLGSQERASEEMFGQLLRELAVESPEPMVAFRGKFRWVQRFESLYLPSAEGEKAGLRDEGVYLITGGLGALGMLFARHFAQQVRAKLVLVGRTPLPPREQWDDWLARHGAAGREGTAIAKIRELEALGAQVLAPACDVASAEGMRGVVEQALQRFGRIDGVLHLAGANGMDFPIEETTPEVHAAHFAPKIHGTLALDQALEGVSLDFCVLFSSLSSVLGGLRFAPYAAANLFMDGYTLLRNRQGAVPWTSVCWDGWRSMGEPEDAGQAAAIAVAREENTIRGEEGIAAFHRILNLTERPDQLVVSVTPLEPRIEKWIRLKAPQAPDGAGGEATYYGRPELATAYAAPRTEKEKEIAAIWQSLLGIGEVGVHDNFFELGGHSLLGTQLISRLRQRYRVEANIGALFDSPTVEGLANYIESLAGEAPDGDEEEREEFVL